MIDFLTFKSVMAETKPNPEFEKLAKLILSKRPVRLQTVNPLPRTWVPPEEVAFFLWFRNRETNQTSPFGLPLTVELPDHREEEEEADE